MFRTDSKIKRIGIFYDGNYFSRVSSYYNYHHERRSRIGISGLHNFIKAEVAKQEETEPKFCQIVDAHYYRGRLKAAEADQRDVLLSERQFDDILVREGVIAHYLPLGPAGEKGIDVLLALESYDLAMHKRYDVVILVTGDGDFLPLVRKLKSLGIRVMVTAWDIKFFDVSGVDKGTRPSQSLLDEATYPLLMHKIIEECPGELDSLGFFIHSGQTALSEQSAAPVDPEAIVEGSVTLLKDSGGYGFIRPDGSADTLFFHASSMAGGVEFNALAVGCRVRFTIGTTDKGLAARGVSLVAEMVQ